MFLRRCLSCHWRLFRSGRNWDWRGEGWRERREGIYKPGWRVFSDAFLLLVLPVILPTTGWFPVPGLRLIVPAPTSFLHWNWGCADGWSSRRSSSQAVWLMYRCGGFVVEYFFQTMFILRCGESKYTNTIPYRVGIPMTALPSLRREWSDSVGASDRFVRSIGKTHDRVVHCRVTRLVS